jgi:AraC-like DNA-binding protein
MAPNDKVVNKQDPREVAKSWHAEAASGMELLYAKFFNYSFARHTHEGFAIGVIEQGANSFYYRGSVHVASAGSTMLINPAEVHTGSASDGRGWTFRMFYVDSVWLQNLASSHFGKNGDVPFFSTPVVHDSYAARRLRRAHLALERRGSLLEQESLVVSAFSNLLERYADRPLDQPPAGRCDLQVKMLRDYLTENYTRNISLRELGHLVHLSGSHLIRVFRSSTGISPHAYLEQVRVDQARKRLKNRTKSLAEVACESGFFDQSHLTRHFKRRVGVTPGEYLRGVGGGRVIQQKSHIVQDAKERQRAL